MTLEEYDQRITEIVALKATDAREGNFQAVELHQSLMTDVRTGRFAVKEVQPVMERMLDEIFEMKPKRKVKRS